MRCARCERTITNEKSVIEGYGPTCFKKKDEPFNKKRVPRKNKGKIEQAGKDKEQTKIINYLETKEGKNQ